MPSPTDGRAIETAGVEVPPDTESIEAVIRDIQIQKNRIKAVADKAESTNVPIEAVAVMRELQSTMLPLLLDVVKFTDRLEEHAEWASQQISDLQGETETASQLTPDDASQLRDFLVDVGKVLSARAETLVPDSEERNQYAALASRSDELVELIDDVVLEDKDDDDDDDNNAETPPAPTPLAAVPTDPAPAPPADEPPTEA